MTLEQVMDRFHTIGDDKPCKRWVAWKAQHTDVFTSVAKEA